MKNKIIIGFLIILLVFFVVYFFKTHGINESKNTGNNEMILKFNINTFELIDEIVVNE